MTFAKWVFTIAGIYGMIVVTPLYFLEKQMTPPSQVMTNPESYYGFAGVALAFQILFLIIGRDPARFRPAMLASIVEKVSFPAAVIPLFLAGRVQPAVAMLSVVDGVLAVLFVISWLKTRPAPQ